MINQEIINSQEWMNLPLEISNQIFLNERIMEMLQNETINFDNILNLYSISTEHKQNFPEVLQQFVRAIDKGQYSIAEILERYEENTLHLKYMSGDPYDIFLANIENADTALYQFVLHNNYLDEDDMQDIRDGLNETQQMDFDMLTGENEEHYSSENEL